jgi:hypothetical protein
VSFTVTAATPTALQRLTSYQGKAYVGELAATRLARERTGPLRAACGGWADWYASRIAP